MQLWLRQSRQNFNTGSGFVVDGKYFPFVLCYDVRWYLNRQFKGIYVGQSNLKKSPRD